jgi:RNA-binding protein YhbY
MLAEMQIGKQGMTDGTVQWLKNAFKTHDLVKIHLLKAAGHDKEKVREINDKILSELGKKYTARIIGFTIVIRKWRKEVR